jgi:hypothetical protein
MEEDRPLITFLCADPKDAELKNYKKVCRCTVQNHNTSSSCPARHDGVEEEG